MKKITKALAAIMLMMAVVMTACKPENNPNDDGGDDGGGNNNNEVVGGEIGELAGHEYVDLGLPSGTLWSTRNYGADTPEGCGDYYAWGEIITKTHYHWENYSMCRVDGVNHYFTKYCPQAEYGYEGFTDTLTVLQYANDVVMRDWANGWRIPTTEQWRELMMNTTRTWTTQNDVNGWLFTAPNGYSLFIPAAGVFVSYGPADFQNVEGYYWSSSLSQYAFNAMAYVFNSSLFIPRADNRYLGYTIRPVCKKPQN